MVQTNQMDTRPSRALLIVLLATALGGCLTSGESNTDKPGNGNRPPTISNSPGTIVMTGDTYSFTPSASDPDGDPLTFSVTNLPRWANFDSTTGTLSGQPATGDEGVYASIVISVSDSSTKVSLPAFSIEVTQTALGSMTLSWTPPTENEDGTALDNLAGYKLYFGTASGQYTNQLRINTPGLSSYVVENLLPDTYYVVATSFTTSGVESRYSNEAVRTVTAM